MIENFDQLQKIFHRIIFPHAKFRRLVSGEITIDVMCADAKPGWKRARLNVEYILPNVRFAFYGSGAAEICTGLMMDHRGDVMGVIGR